VPRYRPAPPPEPSELVALPLHVLVRDWPELDPLLQAAGVDLEAVGHLCLGEGVGEDGAPDPGWMAEQMAAATRWRSDPSS
jgi:hypothetical protein